MSKDGFFLIFNINGVYHYEDATTWGPEVPPRHFSSFDEALRVCENWAMLPLTRYEKQTCSRFIARVGPKACAEFVDKLGRRIVWSDHPGFPATEGYGESPLR